MIYFRGRFFLNMTIFHFIKNTQKFRDFTSFYCRSQMVIAAFFQDGHSPWLSVPLQKYIYDKEVISKTESLRLLTLSLCSWSSAATSIWTCAGKIYDLSTETQTLIYHVSVICPSNIFARISSTNFVNHSNSWWISRPSDAWRVAAQLNLKDSRN